MSSDDEHLFPDLEQYCIPGLEYTIDKFTLANLPKKRLITISADDPLEEAIKTIFTNKILSCPVVTANGDLIGSIGVVDIVLFTINVCQSSQELVRAFSLPITSEKLIVNFDQIPNMLKTDSKLQGSGFDIDKASFLTNYSRRNMLHVFPRTTSLAEAAKVLQKNKRIAVGDKKLENYVTQSELVKFLFQKNLYHNAKHTVKGLDLGSKNVVTSNMNDLVIEAFKKMVIHKVSGIGIVDESGTLVGVISSQDVRVIGNAADLLDHLYKDFPTYRVYLQNSFQVPSSPITVNENDTLDTVITTLLDNKIHRVFVTDEHHKPIRVISYGDVLEKMLLHR